MKEKKKRKTIRVMCNNVESIKGCQELQDKDTPKKFQRKEKRKIKNSKDNFIGVRVSKKGATQVT